ncbi:MAG TPA: hypothetical protein VKU82_03000, partial [Planctomycetaceae bacterium]|nr:hypothetical protein [Planctomycetaceae bacterium]
IVDRLGLARRIKFSPEQADALDMARLADNYMARQAPAIVLMFHSSSLLPGASPYVKTAGDLEKFFGRLRATFEHCLGKRRMTSATLTSFARRFVADAKSKCSDLLAAP